MGARGEIVQTLWITDYQPAAAFLLGYVRTDAPGYREFVALGELYVVPPAEYRFDALLTAMNTALAGVGETVTDWAAWGSYADTASASIDSAPDRLAWLIGGGSEAGVVGIISPFYVPPGGIPLIGATWTQVEAEADRRILVDRHRRNQGYVWGGAGLFRCRLTMHRYAFEALQTGWCLRGKVTLGGSAKLDTPWTTSAPDGAITGHVLGVDSVEWMGPAQQHAVVTMTIATS